MQKLLGAALQVFSELGFDGATTKLVARRADVTESLIVRYFGSKRGLLLALFDDFHAKKSEADRVPYPAGRDLAEEFAFFLERQIASTLETKDFTRIVLGKASVDEELRRELSRKVPLDWHPVLKERLKGYRERGQIRPDAEIDDIVFTLGFQSFGSLYVGHMLLEMPAEEVSRRIRAFAKIYADGLAVIR